VYQDGNTGRFIYQERNFSGKNIFTEKHKTYNIKGSYDSSAEPKTLYKDSQSKRAFLRGAFMAIGSMTDPEKSYQLEFAAPEDWQAENLKELMADFGINSKVVIRKGRNVVYLKDGPAIVDILNVIGAHRALMEFENIRILKEMRGSINRQVNCETANINKVVNASIKQLEDIELIQREAGLESLDENLRQVCNARLANPDVTLAELGDLVSPPLGKSGVNHRMRKISAIANEIRIKLEKGNSQEGEEV